MRNIRKVNPGDVLSAREYNALVDVAAAGANLSVDGADAVTGVGGQAVTVRPAAALRIAQLIGFWTYNPPQEQSAQKPGGWHYAPARLLQRYGIDGWAEEKPTQTILVWAPTGYMALNRGEMRLPTNPTFPIRYAPGDWVWVSFQPESGLWLLVDGYERFLQCTLHENLRACSVAKAQTDSLLFIDVYDDFGQVANWRYAIRDERGWLAPAGTPILCRYMPDRQRWVVFFLRHCGTVPSDSSVSDSSVSESSQSSESSEPSISSESSSPPSDSSVSQPSESQVSWSAGSDKSTAIVPASFSPTGYAALFIHEMPEVRFDDVMVVRVPIDNQDVPIDPRFVEVCDKGTIEVCGIASDKPVVVGARVIGNKVRLMFAERDPRRAVRLVLRLTGIRRGFSGKRFPPRTREQFEANERFINSAYPPG